MGFDSVRLIRKGKPDEDHSPHLTDDSPILPTPFWEFLFYLRVNLAFHTLFFFLFFFHYVFNLTDNKQIILERKIFFCCVGGLVSIWCYVLKCY